MDEQLLRKVRKMDNSAQIQGNYDQYIHSMEEGIQNVGMNKPVIPIEVDASQRMMTANDVAIPLLQDARNTTTMQVSPEGTGPNPYRTIDRLSPTNILATGKSIVQKFQKPLDDKDVIFKYVPLNNVASHTVHSDVDKSFKSIDYFQMFFISFIAFFICYYDNPECPPTERVLKSFVAGLLGVIYIFAYLIKYVIVKCK